MGDFLSDYASWYNRVLTEWFTFIGQIAVLYLLHMGIIKFIESKGFKINKVLRAILGWILFIIIIFPVFEW